MGVKHGHCGKSRGPEIQATQMNALRRIAGSVLEGPDITNDEILWRLGQVGVLERVKKRQEEWKGRLERMSSERCSHKSV